jgi:hypothetical protein
MTTTKTAKPKVVKASPGGKRPGAGKPKGTPSKVSQQARAEAAAMGLLPHEWLLKVARGEMILHKRWKIKYHAKTGEELSREIVEEQYYPEFQTRVDAAKAAAPYYAPRLATQTVTVQGNLGLSKLSDDELTAELQNLIKEMPEILALIPQSKGKAK